MPSLMKITDTGGNMQTRGDSRIAGRLGWIEVLSYGFGPGSQPVGGFGNSTTQTKPPTTMNFVKGRDNASAWLSRTVFGQASESFKITLETTSGAGQTITFVLIEAIFTRFATGLSGYPGPAEQYEVDFRRMSRGYATARSA